MDGNIETQDTAGAPRRGLMGRLRRQSVAEDGAETGVEEPKKAKSLGPLKMVYAAAAKYPTQIALAFIALLITAGATLAIPAGFKMVIDRGFAEAAIRPTSPAGSAIF